ncbi:MAG: DUF3823 domain-containing protein [Actinomycetota bacterium]|jgi:hypothetical protein
MKKTIYISFMIACLMMAVTSCEIDDFPGPDAQVFGAILDSLDGALVEQDIQTGSQIEVQELGFPTLVSQFWVIKNNGEYRNNLVFSNDYDIYMRNGNYYPYTLKNVSVKPGDNNIDFRVVPYIRVRNCNITRDQANNRIVATFSLEAGKPAVKVRTIRLYAFSDQYVGEYIKFSTTGTGFSQTFNPTIQIDPSTSYTLYIDLAANSALFKTGRSYFFRVGAMADVAGVGTIRTNYAPNVKISL